MDSGKNWQKANCHLHKQPIGALQKITDFGMPICCAFATNFEIHMSMHLPTINLAAWCPVLPGTIDRLPGRAWQTYGRSGKTRAMLQCNSVSAGVFRGLGSAKSHGVRRRNV